MQQSVPMSQISEINMQQTFHVLQYFRDVVGTLPSRSPTKGHYSLPAPEQGVAGVWWVSHPTQLDTSEMAYQPLDSHFN